MTYGHKMLLCAIAAAFILGFMAGANFLNIMIVEPAERQIQAMQSEVNSLTATIHENNNLFNELAGLKKNAKPGIEH